MKLSIELIPQTTFFKNLRSLLTPEEWDKIRKGCYKKANYKCEICEGKGPKHPVECHETWEYDEENGIQKLVGLIALCPDCHEVKHIGYATIRGRQAQAVAHFCKINECTQEDAEDYMESVMETWSNRSEMEWQLDVSLLDELKK